MMEAEERTPECEFIHAHPETVRAVRGAMPPDDVLCDLADLYKIFADTTRVRILHALLGAELCVCDAAALLGMQISAVSHQFRILRSARLVKYRREGKAVFYSLADDHVRTILAQGMEHIGEGDTRRGEEGIL